MNERVGYQQLLRGELVRVTYFQHEDAPQPFPQLAEECGREGTLFEDPAFPPHMTLLCRKTMPEGPIRWLRPPDIVEKPTFMAHAPTRFDIIQGRLGDCWMLAGLAPLVERHDALAVLLPEDNPAFESPEYCGIFHFRLFKDGHWYDVPLDDRLPTLDGQLLYTRSEDANEFWPALLEKAYAKLHGSYDHLSGGQVNEALQDFTGGVTTTIHLQQYSIKASLLAAEEAIATNNFVGATISASHHLSQSIMEKGLIPNHAYSILRLVWIMTKVADLGTHEVIPLIYLRNPWGYHGWTGPWSHLSSEWASVAEKTRIELNQHEDGEFWMCFDDFVQNFSFLQICHFDFPLTQHGLFEDFELGKRWIILTEDGSWVRGETAGGPLEKPELFVTNPQHTFRVEGTQRRKVTISLLLKNTRQAQWCRPDEQPLAVGFVVYKVDGSKGVGAKLKAAVVAKHKPRIECTPEPTRERSFKTSLKPGRYLVVPHLHEPGVGAQYQIRVFINESAAPFRLEQQVKDRIRRYTERLPRQSWWRRFFTPRSPAVRLNRSPGSDDELEDEEEETKEKEAKKSEGTEIREQLKRQLEKKEEGEEEELEAKRRRRN